MALGCNSGFADDGTYTSAHFTLKTDVASRKADQMLKALEKLRSRHLSELALQGRAMPKMSMRVVADRSRFNAIAGKYSAKAIGAVGVTTRDGILAYYGSRQQCLGVLMHELTHAYFRAAGVKIALWLNEGLACYYGGVRVAGGRVVFGVLDRNRLAAARRAMATRQHLPLAELLEAGKSQFYLGRAADGAANPRERVVYGEAMTLVHFLKRSKAEAVAGKFGRFLSKAYESGDTTAAFGAIYGTDYAAIERLWMRHVEDMSR